MFHGELVQQTKDVGSQDKWQCLENGTLECETESLICAAQEPACDVMNFEINLMLFFLYGHKVKTKI